MHLHQPSPPVSGVTQCLCLKLKLQPLRIANCPMLIALRQGNFDPQRSNQHTQDNWPARCLTLTVCPKDTHPIGRSRGCDCYDAMPHPQAIRQDARGVAKSRLADRQIHFPLHLQLLHSLITLSFSLLSLSLTLISLVSFGFLGRS